MDSISGTEILLTTASEQYDKTLEFICAARQTIFIHCHDLTPRIYNHPDIASALARFITTNSAKRCVNILVNDISSIISNDHQILNIGRRLSSNIKIHKLAKEHENHTESFILFDNKIYIKRADYTQFDGSAGSAPKCARAMLNLFNELWNHSEPDINLNRLCI